MNEIEMLRQLGRQADADLAVPTDITASVMQTIARRRRGKDGLMVPTMATMLAIGVLLASLQIYSLDWQMMSGSWPSISKYVLFEESE